MVKNAITAVHSSMMSGHDYISVVVLKECELELPSISAYLFNVFKEILLSKFYVAIFKNVWERSMYFLFCVLIKSLRDIQIINVTITLKNGHFSSSKCFSSSHSAADLLIAVASKTDGDLSIEFYYQIIY